MWWITCAVCMSLAFLVLLRIGWDIFAKDANPGWRTVVAYVLLVVIGYTTCAVWLTETTPGAPVHSGGTR